MKTLTIYLPLSVMLYILVLLSDSLTLKYLAFSSFAYLFIAFIAVFSIYLVIKIYREKSCFNFTKYTAIFAVMTFTTLATSHFIQNTHDIEKVFRYEILSLNKNLPIMIDKNIRFERVYFKNDDICYEYTVTNLDANKVNKDFITLALADKVYSQQSLDTLMLSLSKKRRVINYIYHDKHKNFLTKVELKLN